MRLFIIDVRKIVADRFLDTDKIVDSTIENYNAKIRQENAKNIKDNLAKDGQEMDSYKNKFTEEQKKIIKASISNEEVINDFFDKNLKKSKKFNMAELKEVWDIIIDNMMALIDSRINNFVEMYIEAMEIRDEIVLYYDKNYSKFYEEINKRVKTEIVARNNKPREDQLIKDLRKEKGVLIKEKITKEKSEEIKADIIKTMQESYDKSRTLSRTLSEVWKNDKLSNSDGKSISPSQATGSINVSMINSDNKITSPSESGGDSSFNKSNSHNKNIDTKNEKKEAEDINFRVEHTIAHLVEEELKKNAKAKLNYNVDEIKQDIDFFKVDENSNLPEIIYQRYSTKEKKYSTKEKKYLTKETEEDFEKKYAEENIAVIGAFTDKDGKLLQSFMDAHHGFSLSLDFPKHAKEWLLNIEFPTQNKPQTPMYTFFAEQQANKELEKAFATLFSLDDSEANWIKVFYTFVKWMGAGLGAFPNAIFTNEDAKIIFNTTDNNDWRIIWAQASSFITNFFINDKSLDQMPDVISRIADIEKRLNVKIRQKHPSLKINPVTTRLFAAAILLINVGTFFSNLQFANETSAKIDNPSLAYIVFLGQLIIATALGIRSTLGKSMSRLFPEQDAAAKLLRQYIVHSLANCMVRDEKGEIEVTLTDGKVQKLTDEQIKNIADGVLVEGGSDAIKWSVAVPLLVLLVPYSAAFGFSAFSASQIFFSNLIGNNPVTKTIGGIVFSAAAISKFLLVGDSIITLSNNSSKMVVSKKVVEDDRELPTHVNLAVLGGVLSLFVWNTSFGASAVMQEYLTNPLWKLLNVTPDKALELGPAHGIGLVALTINGVDSFSLTRQAVQMGKELLDNKIYKKKEKITLNQKLLYMMIDFSKKTTGEIIKAYVENKYDTNDLFEKGLLVPANGLIPSAAISLANRLYNGFKLDGKTEFHAPHMVLSHNFWNWAIALNTITQADPGKRQLAFKDYVEKNIKKISQQKDIEIVIDDGFRKTKSSSTSQRKTGKEEMDEEKAPLMQTLSNGYGSMNS